MKRLEGANLNIRNLGFVTFRARPAGKQESFAEGERERSGRKGDAGDAEILRGPGQGGETREFGDCRHAHIFDR